MIPFLKQIANIYLANERDVIDDCCFIFPNKRSALFFGQYIKQLSTDEYNDSTIIMPEIKTIDSFISDFIPEKVDASHYEQLFTLYNEYKKIIGNTALEFDRFRFWGEMLLRDFNDVDKYLVNEDELFVNIKRLKEINATFLTDEQREIIAKYWGEEKPEYAVEQFWTHIKHTSELSNDENDDTDGFETKFVKLWEVLSPLYNNFQKSLAKQGMMTPAHKYRLVADKLKKERAEALPMTRYVFVGFNVLSTSEIKIFEIIRDLGKGDFYWDVNSPAIHQRINRASRMMWWKNENFKSLYELPEEKITDFGNIEIVGVPSKAGQAKFVNQVLSDLVESGDNFDKSNAINTAIVLPDESMLTPLLHSLPEDIENINVTMGYPMRLSPVASLIRRIISLHYRSNEASQGHQFYYEDVLAIASHPLLRMINEDECNALYTLINNNRLFKLTPEEIASVAPGLKVMFSPIENSYDLDEVYNYLMKVLQIIRSNLVESPNFKRGHLVLDAYSEALMTLRSAIERYNITLSVNTVFGLLESALASATINFNGEPLKGLQIMGVLETRALDFDNIIMLSMNERIFPRRHYSGSFIPDALRRGYGMSTSEIREAMFFYYFFRLISRAKNVTLVYDSRTVGGKSSERSRYLTQLLYLYNNGKNVRHTTRYYQGKSFEESTICIPKNERIMEILGQYLKLESGKYLSASSLNMYINCPLEFYLTYIEQLSPAEEICDYMDASTYGTIVHNIVEQLYKLRRPDPKVESDVLITPDIIDQFINDERTLDRLITVNINKEYKKLGENCLRELQGDSYALGQIIKYSIKEMLKAEKKLGDFIFKDGEHKIAMQYKINDDITINFKQFIDRIDRVNGRLRLVDYKTGSDKLTAPSIEAIFDNTKDGRQKAILQLMLYCNVYAAKENTDEPIQPYIYQMKQVGAKGLEPIKINKKELQDYHEYNEEFLKLLEEKIVELFNPDVPFTQSPINEPCKFCKFTSICSREPQD